MPGIKIADGTVVDTGLLQDAEGRLVLSPSSANTQLHPTALVEVPGIVTASIYVAGDAVGTIFTFGGVPKQGTIQTGVYLDKDDEGIETDIIIFNKAITSVADHDPFGVSDADLDSLVGTITFSTFLDLINNQSSVASGLFLTYTAPEETLFVQMVTRGTPSIAASNLPQFRLTILSHSLYTGSS